VAMLYGMDGKVVRSSYSGVLLNSDCRQANRQRAIEVYGHEAWPDTEHRYCCLAYCVQKSILLRVVQLDTK
jgi:hypothetical protein